MVKSDAYSTRHDIPIEMSINRAYGTDWRARLKHIWYIIKYGHPYMDKITMEADVARQLAERLFIIADEEEALDRMGDALDRIENVLKTLEGEPEDFRTFTLRIAKFLNENRGPKIERREESCSTD